MVAACFSPFYSINSDWRRSAFALESALHYRQQQIRVYFSISTGVTDSSSQNLLFPVDSGRHSSSNVFSESTAHLGSAALLWIDGFNTISATAGGLHNRWLQSIPMAVGG
ncbi:unnamed protein product [Gongylonema pulchrum]|uniref:Secreted protein n=1 Tax=Gongylonema pulchrum TaxID=637853 RepID=A0A183E242_9BILA|nr:unnamed protein product [Gongylonema pulchrum]